MRFMLVATSMLAIGAVAWAAQSRAASRASSWNVEVVHKNNHWRHYYRRHGDHWRRYYHTPTPETPLRPLSCGEFRFWDGERCVDVRFR